MTRPRVRFTLRAMLIVVALAGVMSSILAVELRRKRSLDASAYHAAKAREFGYSGDPRWGVRRRKPLDSDGEKEKVAADLQASRAGYHLSLEWKYLRSVRRPWLPLEPDPPEPR
jgi:hypothetical protein